MTAMLEVEDLEVSYGKIKAVKGISFSVDEGEVVSLIGTNGAGKTTTLRTIYKRIFFLGADGYGDDEIYIGRSMPRWTVTSVADQSWGEENPLVYGITGSAKVDSDLGYSVKHFFGGPGWKNLLKEAGFDRVYTLATTGTLTAGAYKYVIDGTESATLAYNADAAAILAALVPLVGTGRVTVDGSSAPYTVTILDAHRVSLTVTTPMVGGTLELQD